MTNPRSIFVDVARRFVGIRETSRNRFSGDVKLWSSTNHPDGWKNREPYCAAFLCHVVKIADLESLSLDLHPLPKSPSVKGWADWARDTDSGVYIFTNPREAQEGDIMSMLNAGTSHITLIAGSARGDRLPTIEANTDSGGSREGDGIYEKTRSFAACGEFYRLPCRALQA